MLNKETQAGIVQDAMYLNETEYQDITVGFTMGRYFTLPQEIKDEVLLFLKEQSQHSEIFGRMYLMILMHIPSATKSVISYKL